MTAAARVQPRVAEQRPRRALALAHSRGFVEGVERQRVRQDDAAAFDAMCADRKLSPRKPPPLPANMPVRASAGRVALRRDKLLGIYQEPRT